MKVLYVRISSIDQKTDRQRVNEKDFDLVIEDVVSGSVPFQERTGGRKIMELQNEKQPQNENKNYSKKGESKLDQSSGVPNWVLIILTPLILFGVYYYANQNNQNLCL